MSIWFNVQTPILWSHGIDDGTVLFEAGQAGPPFLQHIGINCEFKVTTHSFPLKLKHLLFGDVDFSTYWVVL